MRGLGIAVLSVMLISCAGADKSQMPQQTPPPTTGNAGDIAAWCRKEAQRRNPSPAWTVYGGAWHDAFVKQCMLKLGVPAVVIAN